VFYGALLGAVSLLVPPYGNVRAVPTANRIHIEYEPPTNPAHQPLYAFVKDHRVLEKLQEVFSPFQFPIELTMVTKGCDGRVNAWYTRPALTICYEYLDHIRKNLPPEPTAAGVTRTDAEIGQFFYAVAHEMGHAVVDEFDVPVLGHQEDAADQFATYVMLQLGKGDARRLIGGAAYSFKIYLKSPTVSAPLKDFSDVHGAPQQRFFNLLCLAYGADSELFADVVDKGILPEHRAKGCRYEYGSVAWAFQKLISPHMDQELAKKVLDKNWLPPDNAPRSAN
jgi:hypothetical protein